MTSTLNRMPKPLDPEALETLQQRIGYHFQDIDLLRRALTHRSASGEHMERLEFLGDAVLGLTVAEYLHDRFLNYTEGELSRMRAALVRKESLTRVATGWKLASLLLVGEGERDRGKLKSKSIAANAVEALIGATLKDGGWRAARSLILDAWQPQMSSIDLESVRDAKSRLQELTQARGWGLPDYNVTDHGAGNSPRFSACCEVNGRKVGEGSGDRKKSAELAAAEQGWKRLVEG